MEEGNQSRIEITVPMAIIIAGVFISAALVVARGPGTTQVAPTNQIEPPVAADIKMRPVDNTDHIRGQVIAPVKIVVFSDPECPFCKRFHSTMKQVTDKYGAKGQVAWVYRNFPLDSLHPKARKESEALECAGDIGGNDKFWDYLDRLMDITPSNNQLDPAELNAIAEFVDLDKTKFEACLNSGKFADKVQTDVDDAISSGGRGTPYSVVISANGNKTSIDGAYPYEEVVLIIEKALADK